MTDEMVNETALRAEIARTIDTVANAESVFWDGPDWESGMAQAISIVLGE